MPLRESVDIQTLELIKELQAKEYLKEFFLVGGTALALHLNHRQSVDIDLFSNTAFDTADLLEKVQQDFNYQISLTATNTLKGSINSIKVDLIAHRYPYLNKPATVSGIQTLSLPDITAMKVNAIVTSGQRSKDFIDVYYLTDLFSVESMVSFYKTKYSQDNDTFLLKSLIYFDEVDLSDWPLLIKDRSLKWSTVKKRLSSLVLEYTKNQGKGLLG